MTTIYIVQELVDNSFPQFQDEDWQWENRKAFTTFDAAIKYMAELGEFNTAIEELELEDVHE